MKSIDNGVKKLGKDKSLDELISELNDVEKKIFDEAMDQFSKGLTYNNTKTQKMKDYLQKSYGMFKVECYQRLSDYKRKEYLKDNDDGIYLRLDTGRGK